MFDRRRFLIGAGALLTASFVRRASAFSRKAGEPLILSAARKPEETLYVYSQKEWNDHGGEWRVSLGPDQPFAPPAPTWREHLRALGHHLETNDEIERVCNERDLRLDELDTRLNGFGWEDRWDNFAGPQARAFHLLKDLDLGHAGSALRQAGQIIFQEFGGSPGNSYTWVELHDASNGEGAPGNGRTATTNSGGVLLGYGMKPLKCARISAVATQTAILNVSIRPPAVREEGLVGKCCVRNSPVHGNPAVTRRPRGPDGIPRAAPIDRQARA
jgi:hypothetical protein